MYHNKYKYRKGGNNVRFLIIVAMVLCYMSFYVPLKNTQKLRSVEKDLTVGVIVINRHNVFYLNDVINALDYSNVIVYNADEEKDYLESSLNSKVMIKHIHKQYNTFKQPFRVRTDVHKTHKYDNVNVVKTEARKNWWRKENMDFLTMARDLRNSHKAKYYLLIEDDNVYSTNKPLKSIIDDSEPLVHMGLGTGAMLFSDIFLESFIGYMSLRADEMPVDWLLEMFMESLGRHLVHQRHFTHIGKVSTKPDQVEGKF